MLDAVQVRKATERAEAAVAAMVNDLEELIDGKPQLAVHFANTAMAAASVILERHEIDKSQFGPIYEAVFAPVARDLSKK